jgi:hypothetical protein
MTRTFLSFLVVAFLVRSNVPSWADSIPEIVAKSKPAIVEIVAMDASGSPIRSGTGFFVSPDGLVVTNFHVVAGAASLTATSTNGTIFLFQRLVAHPTGVDLAILQFQATGVPFLSLGESTQKVEGEKVIVIGNPTRLTGTVSDGIISAFREDHSYIQITAPLSPGSSGSPVLDEGGKVIGVATLAREEGQNLNFAISVEQVSAALSSSTAQLASSHPGYVAPPNQEPPQTPQQSISGWKIDGVLMVDAKEFATHVNATFEATFTNQQYLNFSANRRTISLRVGENEEIDQFSFKPTSRQASDGEWYVPYPTATFILEPFLDPTAIRSHFAANSLYLVNVSDKGSREEEETEKMIRALSGRYWETFKRFGKEAPPVGRSVLLLLRIIRSNPWPGASDCYITMGLTVPPEPMGQKSTPVVADIKLASILSENLLLGFEHAQVGFPSAVEVTVWKVPQPWDIPTLIINLELTAAGYVRLTKNHFESVALALSEGLRAFNDEITIDPAPAVSSSGGSDLRGKLIPPLPAWISGRNAKDYTFYGSPNHRDEGCDSMPYMVRSPDDVQHLPRGSWYTYDEKVEYQRP